MTRTELEKAVAMAILADVALAPARDHLRRGRRFADDSDDTVMASVGAGPYRLGRQPAPSGLAMSEGRDAGAELGLRARAAVAKLGARNLAADPGEIDLGPAIAEQLRQRRQPNRIYG